MIKQNNATLLIKRQIFNLALSLGYEVKSVSQKNILSYHRPVGRMDLFLEDLKARGLNCRCILDVGANRTLWCRMARNIFPFATFYLIEPQIEMTDCLEKFCREDSKSKFFLAGAGARNETLTLTVWDDLEGSSFLPKHDESLMETGRQREIQIITIDDLIASSKVMMPDLIKLDIQGFELEALKGASRTFGNTEAYILETSLFTWNMPGMPLFTDVVNFISERGYVVYDFPGFARRPLDGVLGQCDICFVKKEGFLRKSHLWN